MPRIAPRIDEHPSAQEERLTTVLRAFAGCRRHKKVRLQVCLIGEVQVLFR